MAWIRICICLLLNINIAFFGFGKQNYISENNNFFRDSSSWRLKSNSDIILQDLTIFINELMPNNNDVIADEHGEYDDWIEIYNYGEDPVNLNNLYITDDISKPTKHKLTSTNESDLIVSSGEYLILWADDSPTQGSNHLSFKLDGDQEYLIIFSADTCKIDSIFYDIDYMNVSYGRVLNKGDDVWNYFYVPTPGEENDSSGLYNIATKPIIVPSGGFFESNLTVRLAESFDADKVVYTTDGSAPRFESDEFISEIEITNTTVLRFRCFKEGYVPSKIVTHTYFIDDSSSLKVLSVSAAHDDLYGSSGVFTHSTSGIERPVHLELFEKNKGIAFSVDAGIKKHSEGSSKQTPFRVAFRKEYGLKELNYPIFANNPVSSFNKLILRSSGNDRFGLVSGNTHIRDVLIHDLAKRINRTIDISSYCPVNVYINTVYRGIYYIRERQDEDYIYSHYNVENIDFLERAFGYSGNRALISGTWLEYLNLEEFIKNADVDNEMDYNFILSQIDIDNFIDYWIHEVYVGNYDWLSNNMKFWKPVDQPGKWKWVFWDLDHGLGLNFNKYSKPDWNTLGYSIGTQGDRTWKGANNIIIRKLLENDNFKDKFITRFSDLLNSYYQPIYINHVIDSITSLLRPDMPRNLKMYGGKLSTWENNILSLKEYVSERPAFVWENMKEVFDHDDLKKLTINIVPPNGGKVKINTINTFDGEEKWVGQYFEGQNIDIEAIPNSSFRFKSWSNNNFKSKISLDLESDFSITAYFQPASMDSLPILINEISFVSQKKSTGQWIELYNYSLDTFDLSYYKIQNKEGDNAFEFPNGTKILPYNYLIVCKDIEQFKKKFPNKNNTLGNFSFKMNSKSDILVVLNQNGEIVNSFEFQDGDDWKSIPESYSYTYELSEYKSEDSLSNWHISYVENGSPGEDNSLPNQEYYKGIYINEIKATGNSMIFDEFGDFDDWIELYNASENIINIAGLYLTDDLSIPFKSRLLKKSVLLPGDFLIVWADNETFEGDYHLNFRLRSEGEELAIVYKDNNNPIIIDKMEYEFQYPYYSYGRVSDGGAVFDYLTETPGASNQGTGTIVSQYENKNYHVFPNPSDGYMVVKRLGNIHLSEIFIYNILGDIVYNKRYYETINEPSIELDISHLPNGIYFLSIIDTERPIIPYKIKFIKK